MISTARLKKAVAEALSYLRTIQDIREAEVFAAGNGNLLTRLSYTSHIPCNGVEEPKSTESYGIGIQVVLDSAEGHKIGFGSEPSDLTIEGVKSALEKARKGAVHDPEFVSLPRPTGEKRTLQRYHDPKAMNVRDDALVGAGWTVVNGAIRTFANSETLSLAAGGKENLASLGLILGGDVTILQERMAIGSYHLPRIQTDESTLIMSSITSMIEGKDSKGSGWEAETHLDRFTDEAGRAAAQNAINAIGGQRVRDGEYKVILGRQPVTDLLNNLVIPNLNLGMFYASGSAFLGKLGKSIASEKLTIYDHGAVPGLVGSKGITCEGLPTGKTELIKNGVLVGLLTNYYESQRILTDPQAKEKLGVDPKDYPSAMVPRNGFRFARGGGRHFDSQPGIFATNIVIEGEDSRTLDDLVKEVGDGLYIGRIWYTYPINGLRAGDFTCTVVGDSYIIRDGRIAAPLKPNTVRINDSIHNVLSNIIGITKDRKATMVWAADEMVYAPEIAVSKLTVKEIGTFLEGE